MRQDAASCPKRGLELTLRPHYEFPTAPAWLTPNRVPVGTVRESVDAIKLPHTFLAFSNHRIFLLLDRRNNQINGFQLDALLALAVLPL